MLLNNLRRGAANARETPAMVPAQTIAASLARHHSTPFPARRGYVTSQKQAVRSARIQVGGSSALSDRDGNFLRDHWRIVRVVFGIPQHELERMLAGRKFDPSFGLTRPEMKM